MWNVLVLEEFVLLCSVFYYFVVYPFIHNALIPHLLQIHSVQFHKIVGLSQE